MSNILRLFLALAFGLSGIRASAQQPGRHISWAADRNLIRQASMSSVQLGLHQTVKWLLDQKQVAMAGLGTDGKTISITFRDGVQAAVLPPGPGLTSDASARPGDYRHAAFVADSSPERALVLEPFGTEEMGSHDGDPIVADLRSAGFQVDQLYDSAVTVSEMTRLSQYNVVYFHTHAGVNQFGGAVFSTGELAGTDPAADALVQSQDLYIVQVAGLPGQYYGVLIPYIQKYMGQFPQNSILYIDTCELLQSQPLWNALAAKGVGAFISWKFESAIRDESAAAQLFFSRMTSGVTVQAAMQSVHAAGLDVSVDAGQTGYLGFDGDGYLTLHGRDPAAPALTPMPTPATPTPVVLTATPTATRVTPRATASATSTLAQPSVSVTLRKTVQPGTRQTIRLSSRSGTPFAVSVEYPNGDRQGASLHAASSGKATYSFVQAPSRITRHSRRAVVTVSVPGLPSFVPISKTYVIRFGALDVMVHPRVQTPGRNVSIWAHAAPYRALGFTLRDGVQQLFADNLRTNRSGWAHLRYQVGAGNRLPRGQTVWIVASLKASRGVTTQTSLRVL